MPAPYITYLSWRYLGGTVADGDFVHPVLQSGTADAEAFEEMVSSNRDLATLERILECGMAMLAITGECERLQKCDALPEAEVENYALFLMCCVCSAGWQTRANSDGTVSICVNHPDFHQETMASRVEEILNRETWRKCVLKNLVVRDAQPATCSQELSDERIELPF